VIGLLSILVPVMSAPVVGLKPVRARAPLVLLGVAIFDALAALLLAFGSPAAGSSTLAGRVFVVDATSRLFLLLINLVFLGIATYVLSRVRAAPALEAGIERFVRLALIFIAAGNLAVLSHHLLVMWIFLEATTLAAAPLIRHGGGAAALQASWKYFLFSCVGLALAFLGFACLARSLQAAGAPVSFYLDQLSHAAAGAPDAWRRLGLLLIFLGFGTKLGLAPMYSWLPETYSAAPPAVTALLGAVQFNVVVVAVIRVLEVYRAADAGMVSMELVTLGLGTMAVSVFGIIATRNYKRLIAYASLNHGGVIAIGLGIGKTAAYGAVMYIVSNAFIKAILFLTAGKIRSHYGSEEIDDVSGLIKDMPESGLFFLVGTFALLGFPPFGSFLGEMLIVSGLISGGYFAAFAAFCTILTIIFVALGRSVFPMVWGEPRKAIARNVQSLSALVPKLLFVVFLVSMGLGLPGPINDLFRQVAASLGAE
jgi:hydrogenase-4 component F